VSSGSTRDFNTPAWSGDPEGRADAAQNFNRTLISNVSNFFLYRTAQNTKGTAKNTGERGILHQDLGQVDEDINAVRGSAPSIGDPPAADSAPTGYQGSTEENLFKVSLEAGRGPMDQPNYAPRNMGRKPRGSTGKLGQSGSDFDPEALPY